MVKCAICGREMTVVNPKHVVRLHGISMEEYRRQFPNIPTSSDPDYYHKRAVRGHETLLAERPDYDQLRGKMFREGHARKMREDPDYREHFLELQRQKVKLAWDDDHKLDHVRNLRSSCGSAQQYLGFNTKSKGERLMIDHLIALGVEFEFESVLIKLDNGRAYVPDFYVRDLNLLIEVKSSPDSIYYTDYDIYKHDQSILNGYDHLIVFNYEYDELDRRLATGCTTTE